MASNFSIPVKSAEKNNNKIIGNQKITFDEKMQNEITIGSSTNANGQPFIRANLNNNTLNIKFAPDSPALKALQSVEGIEKFLKPDGSYEFPLKSITADGRENFSFEIDSISFIFNVTADTFAVTDQNKNKTPIFNSSSPDNLFDVNLSSDFFKNINLGKTPASAPKINVKSLPIQTFRYLEANPEVAKANNIETLHLRGIHLLKINGEVMIARGNTISPLADTKEVNRSVYFAEIDGTFHVAFGMEMNGAMQITEAVGLSGLSQKEMETIKQFIGHTDRTLTKDEYTALKIQAKRLTSYSQTTKRAESFTPLPPRPEPPRRPDDVIPEPPKEPEPEQPQPPTFEDPGPNPPEQPEPEQPQPEQPEQPEPPTFEDPGPNPPEQPEPEQPEQPQPEQPQPEQPQPPTFEDPGPNPPEQPRRPDDVIPEPEPEQPEPPTFEDPGPNPPEQPRRPDDVTPEPKRPASPGDGGAPGLVPIPPHEMNPTPEPEPSPHEDPPPFEGGDEETPADGGDGGDGSDGGDGGTPPTTPEPEPTAPTPPPTAPTPSAPPAPPRRDVRKDALKVSGILSKLVGFGLIMMSIALPGTVALLAVGAMLFLSGYVSNDVVDLVEIFMNYVSRPRRRRGRTAGQQAEAQAEQGQEHTQDHTQERAPELTDELGLSSEQAPEDELQALPPGEEQMLLTDGREAEHSEDGSPQPTQPTDGSPLEIPDELDMRKQQVLDTITEFRDEHNKVIQEKKKTIRIVQHEIDVKSRDLAEQIARTEASLSRTEDPTQRAEMESSLRGMKTEQADLARKQASLNAYSQQIDATIKTEVEPSLLNIQAKTREFLDTYNGLVAQEREGAEKMGEDVYFYQEGANTSSRNSKKSKKSQQDAVQASETIMTEELHEERVVQEHQAETQAQDQARAQEITKQKEKLKTQVQEITEEQKKVLDQETGPYAKIKGTIGKIRELLGRNKTQNTSQSPSRDLY